MTVERPADALAELGGLLASGVADLAGLLPEHVHKASGSDDDRDDVSGFFQNLPPETGIWFTAGDPILVLVAVGPTVVTLAEPELRWGEPWRPTLGARHNTTRIHELGEGLSLWLRDEVPLVVSSRLSRFSQCRECGKSQPPEWMHDADLCQGCASANHHIVY